MKFPRRSPRSRPGDSWRIVILVRKIDVAAALSVLAHLLLFALPGPPPPPPASAAAPPLQVVIASPRPQPPAAEPPQERAERPVERPVPRPSAVARPRVPTPTPTPPRDTPPAAEAPAPRPSPAPEVDMMAAIEARRASRRAADAGRGPPQGPRAAEDAASRNLRTLTGGEGVGGVFQILEKGTRRGTFAFNGWKPGGPNKWRTVIEVDAGLGGDIELAMVRRMIEMIREHYTDEFRWESHRLDRVVTLSARAENSAGLEEFLMKEFFDTPGPRARR